jgi:hypothetical protein
MNSRRASAKSDSSPNGSAASKARFAADAATLLGAPKDRRS